MVLSSFDENIIFSGSQPQGYRIKPLVMSKARAVPAAAEKERMLRYNIQQKMDRSCQRTDEFSAVKDDIPEFETGLLYGIAVKSGTWNGT